MRKRQDMENAVELTLIPYMNRYLSYGTGVTPKELHEQLVHLMDRLLIDKETCMEPHPPFQFGPFQMSLICLHCGADTRFVRLVSHHSCHRLHNDDTIQCRRCGKESTGEDYSKEVFRRMKIDLDHFEPIERRKKGEPRKKF